MNLALKDIRHNLGRFLLTCVGLSLLLGIVLAMIGIYRGLVLESLRVAGDRLQGVVTRRTGLGPRANLAVTLWAELDRER